MKKSLLSITACILISTAVSSQTNWTKYTFNPVLSPGNPGTYTEMGFPFVYVMHENDTLHMWYSASDQYHNRIGHAWSTDGVDFQFTDDPLFEHSGQQGSFDKEGVFGASVLHVDDMWYMWFNGNNVQPYYLGNLQVGLATSPDGRTWTRYSDQPVLVTGPGGSWDNRWAYCNTVMYDEGIFKMWYTGDDLNNQNIGYATSTDGINWNKYAGNPILEPIISNYMHNARVVKYNDQYYMWFNIFMNEKERLYFTTSFDGLNWNTDYAEAIPLGNPGEFDADWVWHPSVLLSDEGIFKMWYTGANGDNFSVGYAFDSTVVSAGKITPGSTMAVMPNLASETTQLVFTLNSQAKVTLTLVNTLGETVWSGSEGMLMPGTYTKMIDVSGFKAGIYTVVLTTKLHKSSARLVVLH